MKETLIALIDEIPHIESLFYTPSIPAGVMLVATEQISNREEFQIWKQKVLRELNEIYSIRADEFIKGTIDALSKGLNSYHERKDFNEIKGKLIAIRENIEEYYPHSKKAVIVKESEMRMQKSPKIFISHKTDDKPFVELIVNLIEFVGVKKQDIFCSSIPGYGVPNGKDIFEFLREQFEKYELFMVFVHSANYYSSPISLNEMGAAWVLRNECVSFLLPNFDFASMTGVINARTAGIKLDADIYEVKDRLNQFRDTLAGVFGMTKVDGITWERARDNFINEVNSIVIQDKSSLHISRIEQLSECAEELLLNASKTDRSRLLISTTLSGTTIQTTPKSYSSAMGDREFSRWEAALNELIKGGYMERYGKSNNLLKLTDKGYTYLEKNNG